MTDRFNYKFVTNFSEATNNTNYCSIFQICTHKNPTTNKYQLRKIICDDNNNYVSVKLYNIDKKKYKVLVKKLPINKIKFYALFTLDDVGLPALTDILTSKSTILSDKYESGYCNYAAF